MSISRSRYFGRDYNGVALRCVTIRATVESYVSSSRTDTAWSRFSDAPIRRHVTGRARDAYFYGRMSTRSMEVAPRKGKAASTTSFFVQYPRAISPDRRKGTHRGGGGRGAADHHADSEGHDYVTRIATMMPLHRGKRRDISDEVHDLSDRFDLLRCETRTSAGFAD